MFGATTRAVPADSLEALAPASASSRLLPALQAAAESGVREVTVLTDGRIEDAAEVRRWLPSLGVDVEFVVVGDTAATNRSLTEIDAPRWALSPCSARKFTARAVTLNGRFKMGSSICCSAAPSLLVNPAAKRRPLSPLRATR